MKSLSLLWAGLIIILLSVLVSSCGQEGSEPRQEILGRWKVMSNRGVSVPNSFFWFSMDYLEFRDDGTALGLMEWPPGGGTEIRLNKSARYSLLGEGQIEFVGGCRHQDPCAGVYTVTLTGDTLRIFDEDGELDLKRVGTPGKIVPPTAIGPSPSPTPAVTK